MAVIEGRLASFIGEEASYCGKVDLAIDVFRNLLELQPASRQHVAGQGVRKRGFEFCRCPARARHWYVRRTDAHSFETADRDCNDRALLELLKSSQGDSNVI